MKYKSNKLLYMIAGIVICFTLLGCVGCKGYLPYQERQTMVSASIYTHTQNGDRELYNSLTDNKEIPDLSLDTDYYLILDVSVVPPNGQQVGWDYDMTILKYDEKYFTLEPLSDEFYGEVYLLKGRLECTEKYIEVYERDILYCTISVSFIEDSVIS